MSQVQVRCVKEEDVIHCFNFTERWLIYFSYICNIIYAL